MRLVCLLWRTRAERGAGIDIKHFSKQMLAARTQYRENTYVKLRLSMINSGWVVSNLL